MNQPVRSKKSLGFTLIELIVVVLIIGILAALALPRLGNMSQETADTRNDLQAASQESRTECIAKYLNTGSKNTAEAEALCGSVTDIYGGKSH